MTRGMRNNNPLNIRRVAGSHWKGEIVSPIEDKEFVQFASVEYGIRAAFCILDTYRRKYQDVCVEDIIRRHNKSMGATERKRYQRIHKNRLQAHGVRRKRKAKRTAMAAAGAGHGTRRKQNVFIRCRTYSRVQPLQGNSKFKIKKSKAMNKDTWKFIIQTIVAILTAILTTLGVTSCMAAL